MRRWSSLPVFLLFPGALLAILLVATGCSPIGGGRGVRGPGDGRSGPDRPGWDEILTANPLPTFPPLPTVPPLPSLVPSPPPSPAPTPTEYGIQIHGCGFDPEAALDLVHEAGFTWVKQQVRWEEVEPEPGVVSWDCIDRVVDGAGRRGLKVLLSVTTSPPWSRPDREHGRPWSPATFGEFCLRMVERYRGRIHAVEVFNEPNLEREWGPFMDPTEYAGMLEWAYYGIKQVDPDVVVISAGLAPTQWNAWDVALPDDRFLRDLVSLGGLEWMDCVGAHFNHGTQSPLVEDGQFEQIVLGYREATGGRRPICLTEFGYAVPRDHGLPEGFEWAAENTAEEQAQWLADGWQWAEAHPGVLRLVIVWNLNYWSDDPQDPNALYAIWTPQGLMPAYGALREANARITSPGR